MNCHMPPCNFDSYALSYLGFFLIRMFTGLFCYKCILFLTFKRHTIPMDSYTITLTSLLIAIVTDKMVLKEFRMYRIINQR